MDAYLTPAEQVLLCGFQRHLSEAGLRPGTIQQALGGARHLLRWIKAEGLELSTLDDVAMHLFRDHRCACPVPPTGFKCPPNTYKKGQPPPDKTVRGASRFLRFLEDAGYVSHPGEHSLANDILTRYEAWSCDTRYPCSTRVSQLSVARHLLLWLHACRISIRDLSPDLVARFADHDCLCPSCLHRRPPGLRGSYFGSTLRTFVKFLVDDGWLAEPGRFSTPKSDLLPGFRLWLLRHRNCSERTAREHVRLVSLLLPLLPSSPAQFDARVLRDALQSVFPRYSLSTRSKLVSALRMYLRYLAVKGQCNAALLGALPTLANKSHADVPRYVSLQNLDRIIDTCDLSTAVGIRDRAVLLLLARLALRSGDVLHLDLSDFDWTNARIRVSGKSQFEAWLPLPQDVGDAVLLYLEKARPRTNSTIVFLRTRAPYRPFRSSQAIGEVARSAVRRSGIVPPGPSGSHLFRHSVATGLLRDGASLEVVSTLLRHRSLDSTGIYAKVDLPMLSRVTQPWPGA